MGISLGRCWLLPDYRTDNPPQAIPFYSPEETAYLAPTQVDNQCPECAYGSIDLALTGDGRWKIEWYPVECNVGAGTFRYDMQGLPSQYWFAFTVSNTRYSPCTSKSSADSNGFLIAQDCCVHFNLHLPHYTNTVRLRKTVVKADRRFRLAKATRMPLNSAFWHASPIHERKVMHVNAECLSRMWRWSRTVSTTPCAAASQVWAGPSLHCTNCSF